MLYKFEFIILNKCDKIPYATICQIVSLEIDGKELGDKLFKWQNHVTAKRSALKQSSHT